MDIRTAKVTKAEYTERTWSNPNGVFHVHAIEFDNSDRGEYSSKSENQNKFIVGQTATYEFTPASGKFPAKIKPTQVQSTNGNSKEYVQKYPPKQPEAQLERIGHGDLASSALACATRVYVAKQQMITGDPFTIDQIFPLADRMLGWLKEKE